MNYIRCKASTIPRQYLEANILGEMFRGSKVTRVTGKYIYTESQVYDRKYTQLNIPEKEGTRVWLIDTTGDTEGDQL